eukprot:CAMPEP_0206150166 /NCGR_PEP_ID=MMETSP1473-20131121/38156_1 /ASSEMBLY_ACC=CAM_ASM_001109 /TAXON_ID=1461547 /ORGANISM="Stichococcus sp, Strain RCC1054" /LENGTH=544 /DNA_ID=CAMNT_0053547659 /DNA_START=112 /DNA_END=1746 /DNA_ORIENTATION=+
MTNEMDAGSARLLYWKSVKFAVRMTDHTQQETMTVRLFSGSITGKNCKMLRLWVSDPSDTRCLHALDFSEADFAGLKSQQGILVTFDDFPANLASLFDRCIVAAANEDPPLFKACICLREDLSGVVLQVVEVSEFKLLAHLELVLQPVSSTIACEYLTFRTAELVTSQKALMQKLEDSQADCEKLALELTETKDTCTVLESAITQASSDSAEAATLLRSELLQEKADELTAQRLALSTEYDTLRQKLDDQLQRSHAKHADVLAEAKQLTSEKLSLLAQVEDLQKGLQSVRTEHSAAISLHSQLKESNDKLTRQCGDLKSALACTTADVTAHETKNAEHVETIKSQNTMITSVEEAKESLAAQLEECGRKLDVAESRLAEVTAAEGRSGQMLARLSAELRVAREHSRHQAAMISELQEQLNVQVAHVNELKSAEAAVKRAVEEKSFESNALQEQVNDLQCKLTAAHESLNGNDQMIRWLNCQLNEAQAGTVLSRHHCSGPNTDGTRSEEAGRAVADLKVSIAKTPGRQPVYRSRLAQMLSQGSHS